jgi:hypothetical protein
MSEPFCVNHIVHTRVSPTLVHLSLLSTSGPLLLTTGALPTRIWGVPNLVPHATHVLACVLGGEAPTLGTTVQLFANDHATGETTVLTVDVGQEFAVCLHTLSTGRYGKRLLI